ncbi:sigma-70 family RNA polymerase sigma factor [Sphingobacterium psychroaquaticum]|uniref:RNA polymerase sigma factor n=1 Tax=Sphingobacterium psychroaquaticum TaxID=561061 RepID=UPI00106B4587|nr:sigma-70 family RNA polymerase sigma factor [Sphingobacterium psychroaquaticum]QBQ40199.1 sigma-70 family RNA polymerase sigma factor [Sphingobacterium psychroaquaticum]
MTNLNDVQLLALVKEDNRQAFSIVVDRYSAILYRFVRKRITSNEDAQDIIQEVFASLWNRRLHIEITESLYPYLFKAAKYETIDHLIKQQKEITRLSTLFAPPHNDTLCADNLEDTLLAKELAQLIDYEVDKMPQTMKSAFTMSRKDAKSIKEIARELALSEQTVKNNITLAVSRLRLKFK